MTRSAAPDRLENIADAALASFSTLGFRRTQVSDIARKSGVSQGTIYLYAQSKEALFWIALQRAMGETPEKAPEESKLLARVRETMKAATPDVNHLPLQTAIEAIYDSVERRAPAIRLIERCAVEWPELAAEFYDGVRLSLLSSIRSYLERGIDEGTIRSMPDAALAARLIVETIAWFAMHRANDPDGRFFDPQAAKTATVDALVNAYRSLKGSPK